MRIDEIAARIKHPLDQEFWNWFKNSKVVTKTEKPKIVFHGTNANFSTFEIGDLGFHVGGKSQAENIISGESNASKRIIPLYASIQNPVRTEDPEWWYSPRKAIIVLSQSSASSKLDFDKLSKMIKTSQNTIPAARLLVRTPEETSNRKKLFRHVLDEIKKELESGGYDGIVYKNKYEGSGDSWIAFHSSQLKSIYASHFNPNDGNIFD